MIRAPGHSAFEGIELNAAGKMPQWIVEAIRAHAGEASGAEVARHIRKHNEAGFFGSDDCFYRWHYRMRRQTQRTRQSGVLSESPAGRTGKLAH